MDDCQFLVRTTHVDDENDLLDVLEKVYAGKSPVEHVILGCRAPIMKGSLIVNRYDETPMYVEDVVRMTQAGLADELRLPVDESQDPMTGGVGTISKESCSGMRVSTTGGGHSGSNKIYKDPANVGVRTPEPPGVCRKRPVLRDSEK